MTKLRSASAEGKKGISAMIKSGEKGRQAAERMGFTAKKGGMVMKAKGGAVMKAKGGAVMAKGGAVKMRGGGMTAKGMAKGGAVMAKGGAVKMRGGGMASKGYSIGGAIDEINKKKTAKGMSKAALLVVKRLSQKRLLQRKPLLEKLLKSVMV